MQIKTKPADFIVEEIAEPPLKKTGIYAVYLLKKQGWNTAELLLRISRQLNIPFQDIAYGGRKDRHGLTRQYITIKGLPQRELKEKNYALQFVGLMNRPMGPDLIKGNKFEITVRKLEDESIAKISQAAGSAKLYGYPNYFDDQRFGNFDRNRGFLAEKILKKQYNGALKIYLTGVRSGERGEERQRKRYFFENWRDWEKCFLQAKTKQEKSVFSFLKQDPGGFLPLLQRIPEEEMAFFFSAYQSYLWNEVLRRVLRLITPIPLAYKGRAGDYLFYADLNKETSEHLFSLNIPTPASKMDLPDTIAGIYAEVFRENALKCPMFNLRQIRQAFFKSVRRKALVVPEDLHFSVSEDEIYNGKKKLLLKFLLPRGSYGTMFVKRLFSS